MIRSSRPSDATLAAFGVDVSDAAAAPELLAGGRGLPGPEGQQLLVRALAFRIATAQLLGHWGATMAARHEPVVVAALS